MTTTTQQPLLLSPHGGDLINLVCPDEEAKTLAVYANSLPALQLPERSLCDLGLLAVGGFSPLDRIVFLSVRCLAVNQVPPKQKGRYLLKSRQRPL